MGKLYDAAHKIPPAQPWEKKCPECGRKVSDTTALIHLREHGVMLRVEAWMRVRGLPAATFDEAIALLKGVQRG